MYSKFPLLLRFQLLLYKVKKKLILLEKTSIKKSIFFPESCRFLVSDNPCPQIILIQLKMFQIYCEGELILSKIFPARLQ